MLNFSDRTRTGVFNVIWPLAFESHNYTHFKPLSHQNLGWWNLKTLLLQQLKARFFLANFFGSPSFQFPIFNFKPTLSSFLFLQWFNSNVWPQMGKRFLLATLSTTDTWRERQRFKNHESGTFKCQRPYHIEHTSSRPITEVKQC